MQSSSRQPAAGMLPMAHPFEKSTSSSSSISGINGHCGCPVLSRNHEVRLHSNASCHPVKLLWLQVRDNPVWFVAFVWCEVAIQLPFFLIAAYAYLRGTAVQVWGWDMHLGFGCFGRRGEGTLYICVSLKTWGQPTPSCRPKCFVMH